VGASTAAKFGDMGTGRRFGEFGVGAVREEECGDVEVVASEEAKFGDVDTGRKFGEVEVDGMKFGELAAGDRFGDIGAVAVTAGKFGDIDFVGMRGRKFGDIANESVRLGADNKVPNKDGGSGDVDVEDADGSCANVLSQTAWTPSPT
jgi:hypothetical protein